MGDPRVDTVIVVLQENGHNATGSGMTTDDLATAIVNALDQSAAVAVEGSTSSTATTPAGNPETPGGTGIEGGTADQT